jgi:hypothetical protein
LDIYHWPFLGTVAKITPKEYLSKPFKDVWEVNDERLIHDGHLRSSVSVNHVKKGVMVWVEYTIIPYMGKKPTKENDAKFDPGCILQLLSIGMLNGIDDDSYYDFNSFRKRKRTTTSD